MTSADHDDDLADDFRALREHQRARNQARVNEFIVRTIPALTAAGFRVTQLQATHYRIDGRLDLFPVHRRFHLLPTRRNQQGKRGGYQDALVTARAFLTPASKQA